MNRGHADFRGSLEPNDEVMPYSDDETDDELDASSEEEVEEPPGAPQPAADARPSGEPSASTCLVFNSSAAFFNQVTFQSVSSHFQRCHGRSKPTTDRFTTCPSLRKKSSCLWSKADTL